MPSSKKRHLEGTSDLATHSNKKQSVAGVAAKPEKAWKLNQVEVQRHLHEQWAVYPGLVGETRLVKSEDIKKRVRLAMGVNDSSVFTSAAPGGSGNYIWKRAVNGSSVVQVHRKIYIGKNLTGEPGGDRRAAEERQTPPTTSSAGAAVTAAPTQPAAADGDGHADAASLAPPTAAATQIAAAAAVSSGSAVTPLAVAAQLPGVASGPVHPA
jgi:hypothetical protein